MRGSATSVTSERLLLFASVAVGSVFSASAFVFWVTRIVKKPDESLVSSRRELLHNKYKKSKIPEDVDIVIVGSGMGGLSCAAILARMNRKVVVLEQHDDVCGGGTHTFDLKGYRFDSGLHYTVPWSVPIFALTCLKRPDDVTTFDIMGEADGTVDKIYLVPPSAYVTEKDNKLSTDCNVAPFCMKLKETHMAELYAQFPGEKSALDKYIKVSNDCMLYVKVMIFSRLLPRWLQKYIWLLPNVSDILYSVGKTAKEILPTLTSNKRLISLLSSMWIDTGARPDRASFMLSAAVFRGVSMEGGCYPAGGSESMARELVPVIEKYGGKVLIRAKVAEILVDQEKQRACGVRLANGDVIRCRKGVVSSCGYVNTMKYLLPKEVTNKYVLPTELPGVSQSAGFVMCNIGVAATPEEIGVTNTNTWHIPIDGEGDAFVPLDKFFSDPLGDDTEVPAFITFPSMKDKEWSKKHPNKVSCQMLIMAEYDWFAEYKDTTKEGDNSSRLFGYDDLKRRWSEKCLQIFLRYFPKARDKIEMVDISTPLTIENYLQTYRGGAVGADVTPTRFVDPEVRDLLDPVTKIKGLYLTGQDTVLCGVTLCQLAGVITALRMEGFLAGVKILGQSILLGLLGPKWFNRIAGLQ